jgi:hypothetical protein
MLSRASQSTKYIVLIVLGLALLGVIWWRYGILTTDSAPWGIISLELAGSEVRATQIVQSWQDKFQQSLEPAYTELLIDCVLFIPLYVALLSLGCFWTRDKLFGEAGEADRLNPDQRYMRKLLTVLGWGQFLAACLDYAENGAMWVMLRGPIAQPWPTLAALCATLKFLIVLMALLYTFLAVVMGIVKWRSKPSSGVK